MLLTVAELVDAVLGAALKCLFEKVVTQKKLTEYALEQLRPNHEKNKILFEDLKTAVELVETILNDAVEKQLISRTNRGWVERLTDAVNKTADLLDEIYSLNLARSQSSGKSAHQNTIKNAKDEIEKMTKSLEDIAKLKDVHGVKESGSGEKSSRLESTSLVDKSDVYGRYEDTEKILNFLLEEPSQRNGNDIPLIAIIGMAGIGKTTLAQLLFNHSEVQSYFSCRAWVHVSKGMDVFNVTKTLYENVTDQTSDIQNLDRLQRKLIEQLQSELFLFVFDEVWNVHCDEWDELQKVLKHGLPRSRIIVTTRSQAAASTMRASQTHHLQPLNVEACWSVFAKQAFGSPDTDAAPKLKPIAQDIMKKCGGLPLVARELGRLLYSKASKVDAEEWENILNENLFDLSNNKIKILAWFRLSFNHLSTPSLKQCFAYCSIIPKGHPFDRKKLILLWMAQGFLLQLEGGRTMEEVGINYFQELFEKSFFQQESDDDKSLFKMHDLINELAQFASTIQPCLVEKGKPPNISDMTRHVLYVSDEQWHDKEADLVDVLRKAKFLWTFLPSSSFSSSSRSSFIGEGVVNELQKQKRLRVLSLSYQKELLDEIGKLLHLRYLDLSHSALKNLPKTISSLYTLQTLILSHCTELTKLPKKMAHLFNLGHLDLTGTSALKMMPPEFGKLKRLRILTNFVVSNGRRASSIKELGELSLLRGNLSILELQNVKDGQDAENAKLKEKKNVKELEFKWSSNGREELRPHDQEEILGKLRPHEDIEELSIAGYGGTSLPDWLLRDSSFSKMVILRLSDCRYFSFLPSLGHLSSLQQLHVRNMPNFIQWFTEGGFPSLQELYVENCEQLTAIPNNLTSLKLLSIKTCRQLRFDDLTVYKELQNLELRSCNRLNEFTLNFYRELESLQIHDCKELEFLDFSNNSHQDLSLQILDISDCPNLASFNGDRPLSLQTVTIKKCVNLTLPIDWGLRK